jgi:hypothetical protein
LLQGSHHIHNKLSMQCLELSNFTKLINVSLFFLLPFQLRFAFHLFKFLINFFLLKIFCRVLYYMRSVDFNIYSHLSNILNLFYKIRYSLFLFYLFIYYFLYKKDLIFRKNAKSKSFMIHVGVPVVFSFAYKYLSA